MKTSELSEGDVVWIVLPYEGGRGWAAIDALKVASEPPHRARTVRVSFLSGQGPAFNRTRLVRPHEIVRKRGQDEEDQGASDGAVEALDRLLDFALLPDHVQELGERLQTERGNFCAALERIAAGDFPAATAASEMQGVAEATLEASTVSRLKYVLVVERDTGDGDGLYVFSESDEDLAHRYAAWHTGAEVHREVLMDRRTACRLLAQATADEAHDDVCCEECGKALAADRSPGVWVHDPDQLGDAAYDLNEDHAARPPEGTLHPADRLRPWPRRAAEQATRPPHGKTASSEGT